MAAKTWYGASLTHEGNVLETRPITPPCRSVIRGPVSNGLLVLPPDNADIQFNSDVTVAAQSKKRTGSADRVQTKLHSVARSSSAGERLCRHDERNRHPSGIPNKSKTDESIQKELKMHHPSLRNSDENVSQQMLNGTTESVDNIKISLDELNINEKLTFESKAKFLSCVMSKNYEKALHRCNEMLAIDPENKTLIDYQSLITEKLKQEQSSSDESEDDGSESSDSEADDDEDSGESSDDSEDDEDGEDDDEDGDEEENEDESSEESESSSDSDIEIPVGPINLLMGGLPLRLSSA
ncbi:nucleolar transcription factor 1-like isoform X2 [Dendronephthya gigantea]|uniref:nucleolar transcription factor 1-like isoform X2 n=1 Tax=Dendronephthya gigantea TaxID=151771 RepID=UPI00106AB410|nr:nucleolar transcription factor 1-like isoform X2 [Dendronephthya gigantea]